MEGRLLLKGCSVFRADGRVRGGMSVLIEGHRITRVADEAELPVRPGDWEVRCEGRLVAPGLVDCHSHLVGAQVVPLSGEWLLRPFAESFAHRHALASKLTAAEVGALTAWALARNLRRGVTMHVEHLHAPLDVAGALEAQAQAAERLGARLLNSHATSSVDGTARGLECLEANAAYVVARRKHPLVRGALGLFGSFCCDDELLRKAGRLREELGAGAHFHLGESEDDLMLTWERHGRRIVPRFEQYGLLSPGSVAAYARSLDRGESQRLSKTRTLVALSPRQSQAIDGSNGALESVLAHPHLLGLGTSGHGTLWEELACAFNSVLAIARNGRLLDPDGHLSQLLVGGAAELCATTYGVPCGTVEEGSLADLIVVDHVPAKEAPAGGTPHLLLQLSQAPIGWTIVNGRVTVREGQLVGADALQLAAEAAKALEAVWARAS